MTCQGCEGGELGRPISAGHLGMYRGLVVRVAGYSAFFTALGKEVQDDIIDRTSLMEL